MVSLAENRQTVYYSELISVTDEVDEDGYKTGEKQKVYSEPKPFLIYVSPARGDATWMPFGISHTYTNVMSTCDKDCPIEETSVLWIGIKPEPESNAASNGGAVLVSPKGTMIRVPGTGENVEYTPHNYTVERKAVGLNSILYAIKRVDA